MTVQAWWLLRKLKRAQIHLDSQVYIDREMMQAATVSAANEKRRKVKITGYRKTLNSTLEYLASQSCIDYDGIAFAKVTYSGWYFLSSVLFGTIQAVICNVLIPIIVSVLAAIATTVLIG